MDRGLVVFVIVVATVLWMIALGLAYTEVRRQCSDLSYLNTSPTYYDACMRANWLIIDFPDLNPIKVREPEMSN